MKIVVSALLSKKSHTEAALLAEVSARTFRQYLTELRNMKEEERQRLFGPGDFTMIVLRGKSVRPKLSNAEIKTRTVLNEIVKGSDINEAAKKAGVIDNTVIKY